LTNASAIAAVVTALAGVIGAAAAVGWDAVTRTIPESGWRDLETPFAALSVIAASATVVFGPVVLAFITASRSDRRLRRSAPALTGVTLGASTLAFWIWLSQRIG